MPRLFDAYLAVDWSASSIPKTGRDSIWFCLNGSTPENPSTRHQATNQIRDVLDDLARKGQRVLIGFDFPYGYAAGFADLVAPGPNPAWRRTWDLLARRIVDDPRNGNNRFDVAADLNIDGGPFWGCPQGRASVRLTVKRGITFPHKGIAEYRVVETAIRGVQSAWKLMGAGSVGSQALLGIPRVASLRDDPGLAPVSAVWPFEPTAEAQIVHVEIWPGVVAPAPHAVRDAGQVQGLVRDWAERDAAGELERLFEVPESSTAEEGWILGVRPPGTRALF